MPSDPFNHSTNPLSGAEQPPPSLTTESGLATIAPLIAGLDVAMTPPGYDLAEEIGRGGMGVVYGPRSPARSRCRGQNATRRRAAKSSHRRAVSTEAKITAKLAHPGIPAVHELGEVAPGRPFLAMKLVPGERWRQLPDECQPENRQDADANDFTRHLATFEQICQAVGYAHAHGVIHRDLKPSNVMVGEFGEVQVMDWGLAKVMGRQSDVPVDAQVAESYAPEASSSTPEHDASDEFLHERRDASRRNARRRRFANADWCGARHPRLHGARASDGEDARDRRPQRRLRLGCDSVSYSHGSAALCGGQRRRSSSVGNIRRAERSGIAALDRCGAEPEVVQLCRRCLSKRRVDRPADGAIVAEEVARIRADAEAQGQEEPSASGAKRCCEKEAKKRRRVLAIATAAVIVALSAGAIFAWNGMQRANVAAISEQKAKRQAINRAKQLERSRDLLVSVFRDIDIRKIEKSGQPLEAVLAKKLAAAADQLEGESVGDPLLVADIQGELGVITLRLSHAKEALPNLKKRIERVHRDSVNTT